MPNFLHTVQVTLPTTRIDGTPLPLEEIASFQIYKGTTTKVYNTLVGTFPSSQQTVEVSLDDRYEWFLAAKAIDTDGRVSGFGAEVSVPKGPEVPSAPDLSLVS